MDDSMTYEFPNADITTLVVTNDRKTAARLIECGYTLFAAIIMSAFFGMLALFYIMR